MKQLARHTGVINVARDDMELQQFPKCSLAKRREEIKLQKWRELFECLIGRDKCCYRRSFRLVRNPKPLWEDQPFQLRSQVYFLDRGSLKEVNGSALE